MDKLFYLLTEGTIGKKVRIDSACAYHVGTVYVIETNI